MPILCWSIRDPPRKQIRERADRESACSRMADARGGAMLIRGRRPHGSPLDSHQLRGRRERRAARRIHPGLLASGRQALIRALELPAQAEWQPDHPFDRSSWLRLNSFRPPRPLPDAARGVRPGWSLPWRNPEPEQAHYEPIEEEPAPGEFHALRAARWGSAVRQLRWLRHVRGVRRLPIAPTLA
jgi:hypothetical protein